MSVQPGRRVLPAWLVRPGRRASKALPEPPELKAFKAWRVWREPRAQPEPQGRKGQQAATLRRFIHSS